MYVICQYQFNSACISPQLTLPEGAQSRIWHSTTALSLGPGWTQVTMFGGCPKWEWGKSLDAQQKLAKTTVLEFGEQNTHIIIHSLAVSSLLRSCTTSDVPNQDKQNL